MDNGEVCSLTQMVKEANGLQLHNIAAVGMNRLREINAEAGEKLKEAKAKADANEAAEANAKKTQQLEAKAPPAAADEPHLGRRHEPSAADAAKASTPARRA